MKPIEENRKCDFCHKALSKITKFQRGSPPKHCNVLHRTYNIQLRYLQNLRSRLQSEASGV